MFLTPKATFTSMAMGSSSSRSQNINNHHEEEQGNKCATSQHQRQHQRQHQHSHLIKNNQNRSHSHNMTMTMTTNNNDCAYIAQDTTTKSTKGTIHSMTMMNMNANAMNGNIQTQCLPIAIVSPCDNASSMSMISKSKTPQHKKNSATAISTCTATNLDLPPSLSFPDLLNEDLNDLRKKHGFADNVDLSYEKSYLFDKQYESSSYKNVIQKMVMQGNNELEQEVNDKNKNTVLSSSIIPATTTAKTTATTATATATSKISNPTTTSCQTFDSDIVVAASILCNLKSSSETLPTNASPLRHRQQPVAAQEVKLIQDLTIPPVESPSPTTFTPMHDFFSNSSSVSSSNSNINSNSDITSTKRSRSRSHKGNTRRLSLKKRRRISKEEIYHIVTNESNDSNHEEEHPKQERQSYPSLCSLTSTSTSTSASASTTSFPTRLALPNDASEVNSLHCYVRSELLELFVVSPAEGKVDQKLQKEANKNDDDDDDEDTDDDFYENSNSEEDDDESNRRTTRARQRHNKREKKNATTNTANATTATTSQYTNRRHIPGRVGLRCVHCAHVSTSSRSKQKDITSSSSSSSSSSSTISTKASFFPKSIQQLYREVCTWQRVHFKSCPMIPDSCRTKYKYLKESDKSRGKTRYWESSARELGLINSFDDIGDHDGIKFRQE